MVALPSPSRSESEIAEYLADRMDQLGFQARIDEAGNAVGIIGDGTEDLVMLGHMDTVPGGPEVRIEDGKLYGRGSVDAKGPLAAFIMAAVEAHPPGLRCTVIGAVEEEIHTSRGARYVRDRYQPDYCIIGEPSGWDTVTLGYKGRLLMDYHREQFLAHPAGDRVSAAEHGVDLWNRIEEMAGEYNRDRQGMFSQLHRTLHSFRTDENGNSENVRLTAGFRLPPGLSPEDLRRSLEEISHDGAELNFRGGESAYQTNRRSELVPPFIRGIREAGGSPRFSRKSGTSDMNVVGPAWNCPIVAYGPGDSALDHTPNEHIEIEEFLRGISVLKTTLNQLAGGR